MAPKINCTSCTWSMRLKSSKDDWPMYCPECGNRTDVIFSPSEPDETKSDKI